MYYYVSFLRASDAGVSYKVSLLVLSHGSLKVKVR